MIKAEEMLKQRAEIMQERMELTERYWQINIDTTAVKYYFKQLRNISGTESSFME